MNPITIIREKIAESKRREAEQIEPPSDVWEELKEILITQKMWVYANLVRSHAAHLKHTESEVPMWCSIAERAVEALEKHRAWDNEIMDACGEAESVLTAIAQQLAEGGIE